jgi:transcriptional regulator with XRE-family HTH domain
MKRPHLIGKWERESPINTYRVSFGYSLKEICEVVGCSSTTFLKLATGLTPPYYLRNMKIRPYVQKIVELFNVPLSELFPRYVCDIDRHDSKVILTNQVAGIVVGESFDQETNPLDLLIRKEKLEIIKRVIGRLITRDQQVMEHFINNETLDFSGKEIGVTKERVRQIRAKCIRDIHREFSKVRKEEINRRELTKEKEEKRRKYDKEKDIKHKKAIKVIMAFKEKEERRKKDRMELNRKIREVYDRYCKSRT